MPGGESASIGAKMSKFYWFGDSWIVGDELELTVPYRDRNQYVFGSLISKHYGAEFINCGVSGSSVDALPIEFNKIANTLSCNDTVFFCLSAHHRTSILDDQGILQQIIPGPNYNSTVHGYPDMWFKYFDTKKQQIYNYDRTIALLYYWCKKLEVQCWFMNLFTTPEDLILDLVPETAWLVPRNQCISQYIMPMNANHTGCVICDDVSYVTIDQWKNQKKYLELYVKPGYCHPNVRGHQEIAEQLIQVLDTK